MNTTERDVEAVDLCKQAEMLIQSGKLDEAAAKLETAMDIDPMVWEIYKCYGDIYMAREAYDKAKKSYKQALLINKDGLLYFSYGNACFLNNEPSEGIENYNLALSHGYDSDEMLYFTGMAYQYLKDYENAGRYFYRAIQKNPARPDYRVKLIENLIRTGDVDAAYEQNELLLQVAPELFDGYHIKNLILIEKGDLTEAEKNAKEATERFPEDVELLFDYVKTVTLQEKYESALEMIESAKKMKYYENSMAEFLVLEARIKATQEDYEGAVAVLDECIAREEADGFAAEARFLKLNLAAARKDYTTALSLAEDFVERKGNHSYYYASLYYKAASLRQLGREEEAVKAYKDVISILRVISITNEKAIETYLYRAMAHKDLGEYDKALELIDFVKGLGIEAPEIQLLESEIYKLSGNPAMAAETAEKAYAEKPELKSAQDGEE